VSLTLVVTLTVRRDEETAFDAFEAEAAQLMARHGGVIASATRTDDGAGPTFTEVHVVRFPDAAAFAAYRGEPLLAELAPLRSRAIVATTVTRAS
jgi:antibiotic biosynthesis monooxygenase (ABM) superfamily enzyme